MRVMGVFRESEPEYAQHLRSIHEVMGLYSLSPADQALALRYLGMGIDVFDYMGASPDPLDPTRRISGGYSLVSDGVWVWRHDLSFIVENYNVGLPTAFLLHARMEGGECRASEEKVQANWKTIMQTYQNAVVNGRCEY